MFAQPLNYLKEPPKGGGYNRTNELGFMSVIEGYKKPVLVQKWESVYGDPPVWVAVPYVS